MSWLMPLLMAVALGLLIYLLYSYSCRQAVWSQNNANGVIMLNGMTGGKDDKKDDKKNGGQVVDLDGDRLEQLAQQKPVVVAFVAQGCGWCQRFLPNLVEAAKRAKLDLHTLHAHSKKGMETCQRYKVRGFPSLLYVHKGQILGEYKGDRSPDDVVRWVATL